MKNKIKLNDFFPLGIDYYRELKWVNISFLVSFIYSLGYLFKLNSSYNSLFLVVDARKFLKTGAIMDDFVFILKESLSGFIVIAVCMIALAAYHYFYHYIDSKSIYLMKRLPNHFDLHKRCFTYPILITVISLIVALILLIIYYNIYLLVTPEGCLTPGQWQKIWIN